MDDVREVLTYYHQFDDPLAKFRENQRILAEQLEEQERVVHNKPASPAKKWTPSFLAHR